MDYNETNKLFAQFMGAQLLSPDTKFTMVQYPQNVSTTTLGQHKETYKQLLHSKNLEYHENWSWLMPVVEKINSYHVSKRPFKFGKPESVALKILEDRATIEGMYWTNPDTKDGNYWDILKKKKFSYSKHGNIGAVYAAALEFINWHNKH